MARSIAASTATSGRNRGVLMLAAVFGILSALLMFAFLNSKGGGNDVDKALNSGIGAETVVVVTKDIAVGQQITSDMLTTKSIPAGALLDGRFADTKDIVGKVATSPMYTGEQVVTPKVTTFEGQTTLAYKIPAGMRALSLMVPHEAWITGGLPQPGDRVDILGITTLIKTDPLTGKDTLDIVAGIIAQDVEVLAVAQTVVKFIPNLDQKRPAETTGTDASATPSASGPAVSEGAKGGEEKFFEKAISITLALSPDLAAKVAIIDAMKDDDGQYRIIPRQKGDGTPITGQVAWTLDDVFTLTKKK